MWQAGTGNTVEMSKTKAGKWGTGMRGMRGTGMRAALAAAF